MTASASPNAIIGLASSDSQVQRRAAASVLSRTKSDHENELPLHQRATAVLAEDWRQLQSEREPIILALVTAMGDNETDLLVVNVVAYALASAGEDGLTELLPLLSHETFWIRAYAAEGLGSLDNTARWAVPALSRALADSSPDWTAFTIIRALGNIGGSEAISVLQSIAGRQRTISSPDPDLVAALEGALASAWSQP